VPIDYTKRPASTPQTPAAPVSLTKVTLTKSSPTVSLTKETAAGTLRVNLNWNARPQQSAGFFKRRQGGIDLDLGCLYEYTDGSKGVVQALGNAFRDRHSFGPQPICWLDGDDRSGSNTGGENLYVDLRQLANIRRILVFAYIYEGVPSWAAADGVVTLMPVAGPRVEVCLDEHDANSPMCAIAMLENTGADLAVRREMRYIRGDQQALDRAYGWGLRWSAGRK
jgi:tellurite resistance protein TerA